MNRTLIVLGGCLLVLVAVGVRPGIHQPTSASSAGTLVSRGPLEVWSVYHGKLEARQVTLIMSRLHGAATVVELAPEGGVVESGDVIARFDDAQIRLEIIGLEREVARARAQLDSLEQAAQPLKVRELELAVAETQAALQREESILVDSAELVAEGLLSPQEYDQQKATADQLRQRLGYARMQLELTRTYLHPAALARARAELDSAEESLRLAQEQQAHCTIPAPAEGTVAYLPTHVGTEYRTVRVGDTIHRNQPFMSLPDMSEVVVTCQVPEAELSHVREGAEAGVVPLAYPGFQLEGRVETVSSIAQGSPGQEAWRKFFRVVIALETADPRLRSGMSVYAQILSYRNADSLRLPRNLIAWEEGNPTCVVRQDGREERRRLSLGHADARYVEVLAGLSPGDRVVRP